MTSGRTGLTIVLAALLSAVLVASSAVAQDEAVKDSQSAASLASDADPWEGFNRAIFTFNDTADRYLLKPVAKGYRAITPNPVERGLSNVFSNINEIRNVFNDALQWKWGQAANDGGRFLINSTVGMVGLFDVAEKMGLAKSDGEDFGQTLAVWGVGRGPYVVLPLLGPSSLRGVGGFPVDSYLRPTTHMDHIPSRNTMRGTGLVVQRASLLDAEDLR